MSIETLELVLSAVSFPVYCLCGWKAGAEAKRRNLEGVTKWLGGALVLLAINLAIVTIKHQ